MGEKQDNTKIQTQYPVSKDFEQYTRERCEAENRREGPINDCPICLGKRYVFVTDGYSITARQCECKQKHDSQVNIQHSGLTQRLNQQTFETFIEKEQWQKILKKRAMEYAKSQNGWFFVGGQVGSGKTHVCTAAFASRIDFKGAGRYFVWPDEIDALKGNADGYSEELKKVMNVQVLYMDDFLKSPNGITRNGKPAVPSEGELIAAFKIINYRYNRPELDTIISSEYLLSEIMDIDSGIGSRIYERCNKRPCEIRREENRNIRLNPILP